jgi:long-chain fatty acid transport protein
MKKVYLVLCITCLFLILGPYILAGGIDNRSNYSGEYVRTFTRNAATDSLDAIAYNPAGVMKMTDGIYGNLSIHYVLKEYTNTVDGIAFKQDTPSFVPALFGLYKDDRWAGFFSFTMPAGGGEIDYENGNATTRLSAYSLRNRLNQLASAAIYGDTANEKLNAEGFYYGLTGGGAYQINKAISFSIAGRYIDANKKCRALFELLPTPLGIMAGQPARYAVLDHEENADGWGAIFGLAIDLDPLYIGIKYETETELDFKYAVKQDTITGLPSGLGQAAGIINGAEHERNLPALFSIGLAYKVSPKIKIDTGLIYYFQEDADWGGAEQYIDDGWETSISLEYWFNENLKGSIGYLHTKTGMDAQHALKEAPELDADSFGCGIVYRINETLKIDLGAAIVDYKGDSYIDTSSGSLVLIGLKKEVVMFSAGVQYRF